jgi:hypothetical protein
MPARPDRHCNLGKASVLAPGGGEANGPEPPCSHAHSRAAGASRVLPPFGLVSGKAWPGNGARSPHASARAGKPTRRPRLAPGPKPQRCEAVLPAPPPPTAPARCRAAVATTERPAGGEKLPPPPGLSLAQLVTFAEIGLRPLPALRGGRIDASLHGFWRFSAAPRDTRPLALLYPACRAGRSGSGDHPPTFRKVWKPRR